MIRNEYPSTTLNRRVQGDQNAADFYKGEADKLLFQMKNLMKLGRLPSHKMTRFYQDGTIITAWSHFGQDFVKIETKPGEVIEVEGPFNLVAVAYVFEDNRMYFRSVEPGTPNFYISFSDQSNLVGVQMLSVLQNDAHVGAIVFRVTISGTNYWRVVKFRATEPAEDPSPVTFEGREYVQWNKISSSEDIPYLNTTANIPTLTVTSDFEYYTYTSTTKMVYGSDPRIVPRSMVVYPADNWTDPITDLSKLKVYIIAVAGVVHRITGQLLGENYTVDHVSWLTYSSTGSGPWSFLPCGFDSGYKIRMQGKVSTDAGFGDFTLTGCNYAVKTFDGEDYWIWTIMTKDEWFYESPAHYEMYLNRTVAHPVLADDGLSVVGFLTVINVVRQDYRPDSMDWKVLCYAYFSPNSTSKLVYEGVIDQDPLPFLALRWPWIAGNSNKGGGTESRASCVCDWAGLSWMSIGYDYAAILDPAYENLGIYVVDGEIFGTEDVVPVDEMHPLGRVRGMELEFAQANLGYSPIVSYVSPGFIFGTGGYGTSTGKKKNGVALSEHMEVLSYGELGRRNYSFGLIART